MYIFCRNMVPACACEHITLSWQKLICCHQRTSDSQPISSIYRAPNIWQCLQRQWTTWNQDSEQLARLRTTCNWGPALVSTLLATPSLIMLVLQSGCSAMMVSAQRAAHCQEIHLQAMLQQVTNATGWCRMTALATFLNASAREACDAKLPRNWAWKSGARCHNKLSQFYGEGGEGGGGFTSRSNMLF